MKKKIMLIVIVGLIILSAILYYFSSSSVSLLDQPIQGLNKTINIYSPVFSNEIPVKYTCDGEDISPPLKWENYPANTVSFVIIVFDIDAPKKNFIHWLIYDIPSIIKEIPENIPKEGKLYFAKQGINDFGKIGYNGPCPGIGKHRYVFRIYALDTFTGLAEGAKVESIINKISNHVIAYGEFVATYGR
jgi:Raf kinase inhibitor-like YbhB/YbcL family protein